MITPQPTKNPGTSVAMRRKIGAIAVISTLALGMFSVASAANRPKPLPTAQEIIAATQANHPSNDPDEDLALSALEQLRNTNPKNAISSYLIAAHHARYQEWQPAIEALQAGNAAPEFALAKSASGSESYPALTVLRQLVINCTEEAKHRSDETGESLLQESAILASRLAREATPCDLPVLQSAGAMWQTVEQARIAVWEENERFSDAESARTRLASRRQWWQKVNTQAELVDTSNATVRSAVAKRLRSHLPQ